MASATFSDRDDFLAHGLELAECAICKDPFDSSHWPYQIRDCGHVFGRTCLEEWLQQSDTKGTCPQCRSILFERETESDFEIELGLTAARMDAEAARHQYKRGSMLSLLDIYDCNGFLVNLWKEMESAFDLEKREPDVDAWTHRIVGLVKYLLEGLGLPDQNPDRKVLARELEAFKTLYMTAFPTHQWPFNYDPFQELSRNMLRIARMFPRRFLPEPIVWRAMIYFQTMGNTEFEIDTLQFCDELMLTENYITSLLRETWRGPGRCLWHCPAAKLYLLLVLMAQDFKYNLGPNDTYSAVDVANLLRAVETSVMWENVGWEYGISAQFCEQAARFHHGARLNDPRTVPSKELADPHTNRGLIFCHVRGFWLSAETPDTVAYDATDDHMRYGIEQGFVGADGRDDGSEAGDDAVQQEAEDGA
jgi:hypothetical protein